MPGGGFGKSNQGFAVGEAYLELGTRDVGFTKNLILGGALATSFAGILTTAVVAGINLEKQMARVHTMLVDGAERYLPSYTKAVMKMAVQFADSTQSLTKALYDILSATIPPAKALNVLAVSAKAGVAGMTSTAIAADALTTIINAYALSVLKARDVSDWMFETVRRGKLDFPALATQLGQAAASAAQSGLSLEEFGAAISTVTRNGIPAGRAMTSINGLLISFLSPTKKAIKLAKRFNLELSVGTLQRIGLIGVMKKLEQASAEERRGIFRSVRGFRAASAIMMDLQGFEEDREFQLKRTGRTQEAFTKVIATTAFKITQLKESVFSLAKSFGVILLPSIQRAVEWIRKVTDRFLALDPKLKITITKFLILSPIIATVTLLLPKLVAGLKGLVNLLLMPVTSPILTALTAIAVVAGLEIWQRWGGNIVNVLTRVQKIAADFTAWFKSTFKVEMITMLVDLKMAWENLRKHIAWLFDEVGKKLGWLNDRVQGSGSAFQKAVTIMVKALTWLVDKISFVITHMDKLWGLGVTYVEEWANKSWFTVSNFFTNFTRAFGQLWAALAPVLKDISIRTLKVFAATGVAAGSALIKAVVAGPKIGFIKATALAAELILIKGHNAAITKLAKMRDEAIAKNQLAKAKYVIELIGRVNAEHIKRRTKMRRESAKEIENAIGFEDVFKGLQNNLKNVFKKPLASPNKEAMKAFQKTLNRSAAQQEIINNILARRKRLLGELAEAERKRQTKRQQRIKWELFRLKIAEKIAQAQKIASRFIKPLKGPLSKLWQFIKDIPYITASRAIKSKPLGAEGGDSSSGFAKGMRAPIWMRGLAGANGVQRVRDDNLLDEVRAVMTQERIQTGTLNKILKRGDRPPNDIDGPQGARFGP